MSLGKSNGNGFGMMVPGCQHGVNQHDSILIILVILVVVASVATILNECGIKLGSCCQQWKFHVTTMAGIGHEGGYRQ